MAVHDETYLDSCAAYALGALDGDDLHEFQAHLNAGCNICVSQLEALKETAGLLPAALPQIHAAPELKERIMFAARLSQVARAQIKEREEKYLESVPVPKEEPRVEKQRKPWLAFGLAFASLVIIVGSGLYVNSLFQVIDDQQVYINTQQKHITLLKTEIERKDAILKVLESRRIDVVTMDGLTVNPVGYGKIIWDPDKKVAILQVSKLPAVPKDKDYQLWVIKKQKPISAGVFAVTDQREAESFFKVQLLEVGERSEVDAFAVTLEPKGGVPQPTGDMYLLGKTSTK
ncbi:MAG: anti-sigma factor [Ignavibacteria bacterium]|nr:anti-sigma factor [Ignavibacteria bacterium]MBI3765373.1 anti-sigma factor [Ignavibacteriales bacterium]